MTAIVLYYVVWLIILGFLITVSVYISSLIYSVFKGAPYVPTKQADIIAILEKAHLKKGQRFLEIGSGDGRVLLEAVSHYGVHGKGIEINPLLIFGSRLKAKWKKIKHIEFSKEDLRSTPYQDFDIIYIFLLPKLMETIKGKMERECRKGTLIISHGFKVVGWDNKLEQLREEKPFYTYYYRI